MTPFKLGLANVFLATLLIFNSFSFGESTLICPAYVKKFSYGPNSNHYYSCAEEGAIPVLKTCPEGETYWDAEQKCAPPAVAGDEESDDSSSDERDLKSFSAPVLGRNVRLGCLFDARTNKIYASDSFWDDSTIEKKKKTSQLFSSALSYFAAQSTYDRLSHMNIDASLKLDFLGGLVHVEGSAGYLRDSVESENTVAVVMKAHYTTRSETLPTVTPIDYIKICKMKEATHVVTSITYGMDANFMFKKTAKRSESKEAISGHLMIAVKSIPSVKIEGEANVQINGSLKEEVKNIDVKLFGDFLLDKQPSTYEESVLVYKTLTSHLGTKPEYKEAAKMVMDLTPITRFCSDNAAILISISDYLQQQVTDMLARIESTRLKANTLAKADCVSMYLPLKQIIGSYLNGIDRFKLKLTGKLQEILPKIRGGVAGSSGQDLIALLSEYRLSQFYHDTSYVFLKTRAREIEMIDTILSPETFKDSAVQVLRYSEANDLKMLFANNYVMMIRFNILPNKKIVEDFLAGKQVDESKSWFNDEQVVATMGQQFKSFMTFANANKDMDNRGYLVGLRSADKIYYNVYAQKVGTILSTQFQLPEAPSKVTSSSNTFDSITIDVIKPNNKWVTGFSIAYWKYGRKDSTTIEKTFEFTDQSTVITGLNPNEVYQLSMKYITEMGSSASGPESEPIYTRPCSVPTNLRVTDLTTSSFKFLWDSPLHSGVGVAITSYHVSVLKGDKVVRYKTIQNGHEIAFKDFTSATTYDVYVRATTNTQKFNTSEGESEITPESLQACLHVTTAPKPPSTPNLLDVSLHSVKITWTAPVIADGATIQEYKVNYIKMDNEGNKAMVGTNIVQTAGKETTTSIKSLVQGTTYGFSVKVVTSMGSSVFSPVLLAKTKFQQTELDKLRDSIENEIKNGITASNSNVERRLGDVDNKLTTIQATMEKEKGRVNNKLNQILSTIDTQNKRITGQGISVSLNTKNIKDLVEGNIYTSQQAPRHFNFLTGLYKQSQAEGYCTSWGGHLVTVSTQEVNEYLLYEKKKRSMDNTWIGLIRKTGNKFQWKSGSTSGFRSWGYTQPNNDGGHEDCVEFYENLNKGVWNDAKCDYNRAFICEKNRREDVNVALNKPTKQSSTFENRPTCKANLANDGDITTRSTTSELAGSWWEVDLQKTTTIKRIILNLEAYALRTNKYKDVKISTRTSTSHDWTTCKNLGEIRYLRIVLQCDEPTQARYVRVTQNNKDTFYLGEVEVYDTLNPGTTLRIRRSYPQYIANFLAFDTMPTNWDWIDHTTASTVEECVKHCHQHRADNNGAVFDFPTTMCTCYRNARGNQPRDSSVYYRYN